MIARLATNSQHSCQCSHVGVTLSWRKRRVWCRCRRCRSCGYAPSSPGAAAGRPAADAAGQQAALPPAVADTDARPSPACQAVFAEINSACFAAWDAKPNLLKLTIVTTIGCSAVPALRMPQPRVLFQNSCTQRAGLCRIGLWSQTLPQVRQLDVSRVLVGVHSSSTWLWGTYKLPPLPLALHASPQPAAAAMLCWQGKPWHHQR